jgi:hypothetical protein
MSEWLTLIADWWRAIIGVTVAITLIWMWHWLWQSPDERDLDPMSEQWRTDPHRHRES